MVPMEYVRRQAHLRAPFMRAAHKGCGPGVTGGLGGVPSPQRGSGRRPRSSAILSYLKAAGGLRMHCFTSISLPKIHGQKP